MNSSLSRRQFLLTLGTSLIAAQADAASPTSTDVALTTHANDMHNKNSAQQPIWPCRQIHLDFHTSEFIEGIGAKFNKRQFQEALEVAHVNSINVFAKCWHGWSYHNTKVGVKHPHLSFDLLAAQIEACHEIGIKAPIYLATSHAESDLERHPEWILRDRNGKIVDRGGNRKANPNEPRPFGTWTHIAPLNSYFATIITHVEELCINYAVDGFWFDGIYLSPVSYNKEILDEMQSLSLDTTDDEAVRQYNASKWIHLMEDCNVVIKRHHPDATIFYNSTTFLQDSAKNVEQKSYRLNTQNELEDLPTTSWGWYDKFPLRSKFFHKEKKPIVAMSGKFHEGWGEFGGFKHPDAIRYEAASMISFGAGCNFGDQLHPSGTMDLATYKNIGIAYQYVAKIESYGMGGVPCSNLGLWFTDVLAADEGVSNMLLESQIDYEVIDPDRSINKYSTIVIPSGARLTKKDIYRIQAFINEGGSIVALGEGLLNPERSEFALPIGASFTSAARFDCDYMKVDDKLGRGIVMNPFLCNFPAVRVTPDSNSTVLAEIYEPYFSRTYAKYCSHRNTPPRTDPAGHPAIIQNGTIIYFAHNIDQIYYEFGARLHRDVFVNALRRVYKQPTLTAQMPSSARVSLLHQPLKSRYVVHLLYASPIKRGRVHVIEDIIPLHDIKVTLRVPETINRIFTIPDGAEIGVLKDEGMYCVNVPKLEMHKGIVFEYCS
jgi:Hypothetical glycosyl hydrolase 6